MTTTIHDLRQNCFKVKVQHFRAHLHKTEEIAPELHKAKLFPFSRKNHTFVKPNEVSPKGGKTIVEVTSPDGFTGKGEINCYYKDAFCYKTGSSEAIKIAMTDIKRQRGRYEGRFIRRARASKQIYN